MDNWESEDKQFLMALGNFDDMDEYVEKKMKVEKVPVVPKNSSTLDYSTADLQPYK